MLFNNLNLTTLQRRTMGMLSGVIFLTILTNVATPSLSIRLTNIFPGLAHLTNGEQTSPLIVGLLSLFAVIPVLMAVGVVGHYLKSEPDEFIRTLVVRALLWGFAVTMAGNAVAEVFMNIYLRPFPLSILNADIFFISTGIAFRLLQRSYQ